jgi:hypothetical protein
VDLGLRLLKKASEVTVTIHRPKAVSVTAKESGATAVYLTCVPNLALGLGYPDQAFPYFSQSFQLFS